MWHKYHCVRTKNVQVLHVVASTSTSTTTVVVVGHTPVHDMCTTPVLQVVICDTGTVLSKVVYFKYDI